MRGLRGERIRAASDSLTRQETQSVTGCNVIPFSRLREHRARVDRIARLAHDAEELLRGHGRALDLSDLLDLLEQASQALAELGAVLLAGDDTQQMEVVLVSLDTLIARTRDRLR
jgi:hypothetical protein